MNKTAIFTAGLVSAGIVGLALILSNVIEIKKPATEVRCIHGFATINKRAAESAEPGKLPELEARPESVDVQQGCNLILQIVPPREKSGDVTIKHELFPNGDPKSNRRWLDTTNAGSRDLIVIGVPDDAKEGIHKYSVEIPGFEKLDPYANVIPD
ncbi:MAG: hypothetical protein O6946_00125 [Gammaproteobacteria bacterium]|nr:hypothetical protein [Gammaproteobacteria bacterium]MCZ6826212.1 hypothetical protein [Gammaproteobacteria bacterium]MCZ6911683.1 hypothetical protein [Pseudomonadota bacterium]